jgi:hypothetical protein
LKNALHSPDRQAVLEKFLRQRDSNP